MLIFEEGFNENRREALVTSKSLHNLGRPTKDQPASGNIPSLTWSLDSASLN